MPGLDEVEPVLAALSRSYVRDFRGIQNCQADLGDNTLVQFVGLKINSDKYDGLLGLDASRLSEVERGEEPFRGELRRNSAAKTEIPLNPLHILAPGAVKIGSFDLIALGLLTLLLDSKDAVDAASQLLFGEERSVFRDVSGFTLRDVVRKLLPFLRRCRATQEARFRCVTLSKRHGEQVLVAARKRELYVQFSVDDIEEMLHLVGGNKDHGLLISFVRRSVEIEPVIC